MGARGELRAPRLHARAPPTAVLFPRRALAAQLEEAERDRLEEQRARWAEIRRLEAEEQARRGAGAPAGGASAAAPPSPAATSSKPGADGAADSANIV